MYTIWLRSDNLDWPTFLYSLAGAGFTAPYFALEGHGSSYWDLDDDLILDLMTKMIQEATDILTVNQTRDAYAGDFVVGDDGERYLILGFDHHAKLFGRFDNNIVSKSVHVSGRDRSGSIKPPSNPSALASMFASITQSDDSIFIRLPNRTALSGFGASSWSEAGDWTLDLYIIDADGMSFESYLELDARSLTEKYFQEAELCAAIGRVDAQRIRDGVKVVGRAASDGPAPSDSAMVSASRRLLDWVLGGRPDERGCANPWGYVVEVARR